MLEDKDITYLGIITVIFFVAIIAINGIAILQYQRGYQAGVESVEVVEEEESVMDWKLPKIKIFVR